MRGEGGLGFQRYDTTAGRGSASFVLVWVFLGRRQLSARLERHRDMFSADACQASGDGRDRR
ncbi:MAG TPA: hypothetical protein DEB32_06040 [Stenotrophomonas sp.]|nr:hypothetical protein G9274_002412 [Stenotrophomonas rhizophila]HBS62272.1 hypothetical protein [Stenotrophomonas sp.]